MPNSDCHQMPQTHKGKIRKESRESEGQKRNHLDIQPPSSKRNEIRNRRRPFGLLSYLWSGIRHRLIEAASCHMPHASCCCTVCLIWFWLLASAFHLLLLCFLFSVFFYCLPFQLSISILLFLFCIVLAIYFLASIFASW